MDAVGVGCGEDRANRRKHGIGFEDVRSLFESEVDYLVIFDEQHSNDEERFIAVGPVRRGLVVVVYTEPEDDVIRIISARRATRTEARLFVERAGGPR